MIQSTTLRCLPILVLLSVGCFSTTKRMYPVIGTLEGKDPRFWELIAPGTPIERLAEGFEWSEGPAWSKSGGYLVFSDIPKNSIMRWKEMEGTSLYMKPSGYTGTAPFTGKEPGTNGLAFDSEGRLLSCEHGDRRVARVEKDGKKVTLADNYKGKKLNSPNDLALKSNGDIYFTDPPYGLPKQLEDPGKELDFQGVYRLTPKGDLTLLTSEVPAPNGIAFSPDEKTLYVANSQVEKAVWFAFDVKTDGTLGPGRILQDITEAAKATKGEVGVPDGMKVDAKGNLFASGVGGIYVLAPDGTHIGTIKTDDKTANCAWGDDGSVLYMTVNHRLARIKTLTKGKGF